jgi:5'-3' exonuclease
LSWKGRATGVIFGFLKAISTLKDEFCTDRIAFCFEHPHLLRRDLFPDYKGKRRSKGMTEEEKCSYESLTLQISELRHRYLPEIGFKNVFCFRGMESDDIMAMIALHVEADDEVVLVTSDSDLFQCLRHNVHIYSPQKRRLLTSVWFRKTYGISPKRWAFVKALAGCHGDNVPGIAGIGELTALRFLRGELKETSSAYMAIAGCDDKIWNRNKRLVRLPLKECPVPKIVEDAISVKAWRNVCGMLGMRSIASHPPIATRKNRK